MFISQCHPVGAAAFQTTDGAKYIRIVFFFQFKRFLRYWRRKKNCPHFSFFYSIVWVDPCLVPMMSNCQDQSGDWWTFNIEIKITSDCIFVIFLSLNRNFDIKDHQHLFLIINHWTEALILGIAGKWPKTNSGETIWSNDLILWNIFQIAIWYYNLKIWFHEITIVIIMYDRI